jgi:phage terminase large subunit-like protein
MLTDCDRNGELKPLLMRLKPDEFEWLSTLWPVFARPDQLPPSLAETWTTWLLLGGRGAGKTRAGAEWVHAITQGKSGFATAPIGRIALIGETFADVREVMVGGVSGLISIAPRDQKPKFIASRNRLEWPNGALAIGFSSEDPEALRGHQFEAAWCDELGKWRQAEAVWDMLQFGLRLGTHPRQVVTTTPRPTPLLKRLAADAGTRVSRATTAMNRFNLAPGFLDRIIKRYQGTTLGKQEIDGLFVEDRPDALFQRAVIEAARIETAPDDLARVVIAIDPPAGGRHGCCGIVAAGRAANGTIIVLSDESIEQAGPDVWASRAVTAWHRFEADAMVAEVNMGGDMVASVLRSVDPSIPVTSVRATRGKSLRAEPVAALYAQGKVKHAGVFPKLEDQMALFGPEGLPGGGSPDRLDALVWAVTALMQGDGKGRPQVRKL